MLRYVGKLPSPFDDDYTELSARFAFQASEKLELSLSGFNLLDDTHQEYVAPTGNGIRRFDQRRDALDFLTSIFGTWLTRVRGGSPSTEGAHP